MEVDQSSVVYPGKMLVQTLEELHPGEGTYVYLGKIYSQLNGTIRVTNNTICVVPRDAPSEAV